MIWFYNAIQFVIKFRWWFIIGGAIVALGGAWGHGFFKGASWKEQRMEAKTIIKTVTIREKQNEIRDNRPSVSRTANRMRNNTF